MFMNRIERLPIWAHGIATLAAFGVWQGVRIRLDQLYALSNHPVDYATGQTTFDATRIKGFYAHMQDAGTLDVYVATQRFDFLFLAMVAIFGILLGTFIARFARPASWGRRLALTASGLAVFGAMMDASENIVSFIMLANPAGFADWLALPYSAFAVIKFGALTLAMVAALTAILFILAGRLFGKAGVHG